MRSMRLLAMATAVLGLSVSGWAQAQPEKKAAEAVTPETRKKVSAKKKAAEEVAVEKKAEVTGKKTPVKPLRAGEWIGYFTAT